jgi:RNA polymerase sigma-70 factor (ECF subfamily)
MADDHDGATRTAADLGEVYRAHAHDLRHFALYLSGDAALADDLVAEAFFRAWTLRDGVRTATVRGYLFAIVRNLFLTHLRSERRRVPLDDVPVRDLTPGPEDRAVGESDLRVTLAALRRLPEIDRAAVLMRANAALPYEDIAAALGISTSAAKVKVHRARLRLAAAVHTVSGVGLGRERDP